MTLRDLERPLAHYTLSQKMSQVWLAIPLTHIHQFLAHVISRHSKIGYRYNFLNYFAFTLVCSEVKWRKWRAIHVTVIASREEHSAEHHRQGRWSMESTTVCMRDGEGASFWTSAVNNQFFPEPPTVYRRRHVALNCVVVCKAV